MQPPEVFYKKMFLKILQISQVNTWAFNKVAGLDTYFEEHLPTAASAILGFLFIDKQVAKVLRLKMV